MMAENTGYADRRSIQVGPGVTLPGPFLHVLRFSPARRLLRTPLFAKLMIANGVIVAGVAVACRLVAGQASSTEGIATLPFAGVAALGFAAMLIVNGSVVWLALTPLRSLQSVAARVRTGDLDARVPDSPLADDEMHRLIATFNAVLDGAELHRRRLRDVSSRSQAMAEDERKRVARELHDGIAQTLAALRIRIRLARTANDPQLRESILSEVGDGIGEAIQELRRVARGLRPPALEMLGLAAAIESHALTVTEAAGVEADVQCDNVNGLLPPETELALYRIMQEALSNVLRHSGAGHVEVRLRRGASTVELCVEDDGRGFNPQAPMKDGRGLGLFGMEERAVAVGGRLTLRTRSGEGTRVDVSIPISSEAYV